MSKTKTKNKTKQKRQQNKTKNPQKTKQKKQKKAPLKLEFNRKSMYSTNSLEVLGIKIDQNLN